MLRRGKPPARKGPRVTAESPATLTPEELHDLGKLAAEWRSLLIRSRSFVTRLRRDRGLTARAEIESRLLCVLHDSLAPAVEDLGAIEKAARAPEREGR